MSETGKSLSREEFEKLLENNLASLRTYVQLRAGLQLRRHEPVSDVVQSAVREVWEEQSRFRYTDEPSFRAFLFRIATNKLLSKSRYWAAERRSPRAIEPLSDALWDLPQSEGSSPSKSPSRGAIQSEDVARLREAFAELSEEDQRILALRRVFDVPVSEIARELHLAESTVRWRLAMIQTQLADRLE